MNSKNTTPHPKNTKFDTKKLESGLHKSLISFLKHSLPNGEVIYRGQEIEVKGDGYKYSYNVPSKKWFEFHSGTGGIGPISLYQNSSGKSFLEACEHLDSFFGIDSKITREGNEAAMEKQPQNIQSCISKLGFQNTTVDKNIQDENRGSIENKGKEKPLPKDIFQSAAPIKNTLGEKYFSGRGISIALPPTIKFLNSIWNGEAKKEIPCIISMVSVWPYKDTTAIHRIYLQEKEDGYVSKASVETPKMMLGSVSSGAVRLSPLDASKPIILAEGIETALSLLVAYPDAAVWAVLSASNFQKLKIPEHGNFSEIIIAADHDKAGIEAAKKAAKVWTQNGFRVKIAVPEKEKEDFNDVLCGPGGVEKIRELIERASLFEPPQETLQEAVERLAALSPLEYDQVRQEEAKKFKVQLQTLDTEVKKRRTQGADEGSESNLFPHVEDWPEPVDLPTLLNELVDVFKRFAVLPTHAAETMALWVVFTWCINHVNIAPILAICSPEKQCGKTTVLSVLLEIVRKPLTSSNITPASLFRSIEKWNPTLIIDEGDTFIEGNEELRGIINSGHTRKTAYVIRSVGDTHEPKQFATWGAKVIALIGKLPATIHDRSIVINLRRKLHGETVEKIRDAEDELFGIIRSKLKRFSNDHGTLLREARPQLPEDISDRAQDNWEPLLAIATLAGEEWIKKTLSAAQELSSQDQDIHSTGNQLLIDIKEIFDEENIIKIFSHDLVNKLCGDDERGWSTYNRGKPINQRQLSQKLTPYGIQSKTIRDGSETRKGFERKQFDEAFSRYIFSIYPPDLPVTTSQPNVCKGLDVTDAFCVTAQSVTTPQPNFYEDFSVTDCAVTLFENVTEKPNVYGSCDVVTGKFRHTRETIVKGTL